MRMTVGVRQVSKYTYRRYNDCVIATASVDKTVRLWDIRVPARPMHTLGGHTYAVRCDCTSLVTVLLTVTF
jgi:WD40 repeat protein